MLGSCEGRKHNEGRRRLLALLQNMTQGAIAALCRVSVACVSYWASGRSLPEYSNRKMLESQLDIPRDAWDEPPAAPVPAEAAQLAA